MRFAVQKIFVVSFILCLNQSILLSADPEFAVVIAPVLDLGNPPSLVIDSTAKEFNNFALAGGNLNQYVGCPRIHQLIYHEIVKIKKVRGSIYDIEIPHAFYTSATSDQHNTYWVDKSNVITFKKLKAKNVDLNKFPEPVSFIKKNNPLDNDTVVLLMPHTDPVTRISFSAGTRFKRAEGNTAQESETVAVYAFDKTIFNFKTIELPKEKLMLAAPNSSVEKIKSFVSLVRSWAHLNSGFIPYVWGGSSFINVSNGKFNEILASQGGTKTSFYELSDFPCYPKTGLDCSGFVCRAAQICGIPYYFKNTATIARNVKELKNNEKLEDGDLLLLLKGNSYVHVMIVSSLKKNLLVEAGAYKFGYGKVHEIALNKIFNGINTYQDLIKAYRDGKPVARLHTDGTIVEENQIKIMKLASVWS